MPSAYVAQITGTAGNYQVSAVRQCALSDIPADQRANWRDTEFRYPDIDNSTQIRTIPIYNVNADGSVVTILFKVENLDTAWAAMNLTAFANRQSVAKAMGGIALPNGVELATDSAKSGEIVDAIEAIERGWAADPFTIQTVNGQWISLAKADLLSAGAAIAQFRVANYAARKACLDAIAAGAITTEADVL